MVVLVRGDVELASWPLTGCDCPGLAVVEELARLQLAARRRGCSIRLRDACDELLELLHLLGLGEVVRGTAAVGDRGLATAPATEISQLRQDRNLCLQPVRQAESGEQVGVEEVVVPDDPVA